MMSQRSIEYIAAQAEKRHWELGKDRARMLAQLAAVNYNLATECSRKGGNDTDRPTKGE